jgi:5-formaminoimidazole-4-carboxamide-1-(beta)-D-ribofuranosyl 5'-monophosphate synthetase
LGSHSALEICRGAQAAGLRSIVVAQRGRHRVYAEHFATREGGGCVDEVVLVERFRDVLDAEVQARLCDMRAVWVPHRSFEVYLDSDYDAIENRFQVPMFGNRRLEAARGFERAFFVARDAADYARIAEARIAAGVFSRAALEEATIEEFVLGAQINLNFFWSPLERRLELLGTDARRQTNAAGLAGLPGFLHQEMLEAVPLKFEGAGHMAVTVLESMLERAFDLGERFVAAAERAYPPGPPAKDFVVVDVSPRVPGSPGITATPYSGYLHGRPVSVGERIAIELGRARATDRLDAILT